MEVCSKCGKLNVKIKCPNLNNVAKRTAVAELLVHKSRSKKFYAVMQYEQSKEGKDEKQILSLAFDYMRQLIVSELFWNT